MMPTTDDYLTAIAEQRAVPWPLPPTQVSDMEGMAWVSTAGRNDHPTPEQVKAYTVAKAMPRWAADARRMLTEERVARTGLILPTTGHPKDL